MTLRPIPIPDSIKNLPITDSVLRFIDTANERIEAFMLEDDSVIENFVNCDFHLVAQTLDWIEQNHLLTGNRFCELGSGFGVVVMLASMRNMQSIGIEIESRLVQQAVDLAEDQQNSAQFFQRSFVPRGVEGIEEQSSDIAHVVTEVDDVYGEIGLEMDDFDLFFAFPWPGEHSFFELLMERCAATGAMLLTYRGREGMHLLRKT